MIPLAKVKVQVVARIRTETADSLNKLAKSQGMKLGPFIGHVGETVAKCPPEKFHAAMAEFLRESERR